MKLIPVSKNKHAIVDDEDFDWLSKYKWSYSLGYAVTGYSPQLRMHRLICKTPSGMETDHINGDRLDNRRSNLRICTTSQNQMNSGPRSNSKTGVRGVSFHKVLEKYQAAIKVNGRKLHLGTFDSLEAAKKARLAAERHYFGEFRMRHA